MKKDIIKDSLTKQIIDRIYPTIKENALKECSVIVKIAKDYINNLGGFEKLAEWGLF